MSFINSFKRALGFPDDYDNEEDLDEELDEDLVDDPDPTLEEISAADSALIELSESPHADPIVTDEKINAITDGIFNSVLGYFNSHQPELVQKCIDLNAQRKLIVANMDSELKQRIAALADTACRKGESKWAEKQQRMGAEITKLKSEYNSIRQQREEYQSAQLSATRQKRALNDRIRDLENQVTTLEAEREQLQLENKSMVNRLRNADTPVITMSQPASDPSLAEELQKVKARLEQTLADNNRLKDELQQATTTSSSGLSEEQALELEQMERQLTPLRQLKDEAEAKVIALTKEIKESDATIAALQRRLADNAKENEESARTIESLKNTIEANLRAHAEAESTLRDEVARLRSISLPVEPQSTGPAPDPTPATMPQGKKHRKKRRRKRPEELSATIAGFPDAPETSPVKISAIDELMESTDWFVAPDPVPLKKDPEVEEIFGYKEPQKKNDTPDDDRQMTLW